MLTAISKKGAKTGLCVFFGANLAKSNIEMQEIIQVLITIKIKKLQNTSEITFVCVILSHI